MWLVLLLALASDGRAAAPAAPAAAEVPVLVELFTSEGCSSCPPADALLAELAAGSAPGTRVVALSEHVDYWDDLGWRDPFSAAAFTRRQEAYARRLGRSSVYTPQLVVAGRWALLGSDRAAALAAIAAAAREPSGRLSARLVPGATAGLVVEVSGTWRDGVPADVLLAIVQDHATTRVARGENAGRSLEHVSVVRSLSKVGQGTGAFSGQVTVPRPDVGAAGHAVIFLQERGAGAVHAATALPLP